MLTDQVRTRRLADCGKWLSGGTPSTEVPAYWGGGIPWITSGSLTEFMLRKSERTLTNLGLASGSRLAPAGSVLFVVRGMSLKTEFRIGISTCPLAFGQDCKAIVPAPDVDGHYLAYFLLSRAEEILGMVDEAGHGTGRLATSVLEALEVPLPTLPEQRRIAQVLGALDDKIELTRQMAQTLEEMARALFKSWFIDFDPVHAKAEGRPTGLPPETDDLFPDSLNNDGIPTGWQESTVGQAFDIVMGQSPPGDTYNTSAEGIPFYQGRADFGYRYPSVRVYCTAPTRHAKQGDTLISVRAPVGDINMASDDCAIGRGVASARHKSGSRSLTYYFMKSLESKFKVFESEGTVFGSLSKKDFQNLKYIAPPGPLVQAFERLVCGFDSRLEVCQSESRTLAAIRDSLLPNLIAGKLMRQQGVVPT